MTWFDTGGNTPPYEPPPGAFTFPAHPAEVHPDDDERAEKDIDVDYRCPYCYRVLLGTLRCDCKDDRG